MFVLLLSAELLYFRLADKFNIIDKPNERSSHSSVVLRGGGVIFSLAMVAWAILMVVQGECGVVLEYLPFLVGLLLVAGVSLWDDVKSLPDSVRLVVIPCIHKVFRTHFIAVFLFKIVKRARACGHGITKPVHVLFFIDFIENEEEVIQEGRIAHYVDVFVVVTPLAHIVFDMFCI